MWIRKCPNCGCEITYKEERSYERARKNVTSCNSCSKQFFFDSKKCRNGHVIDENSVYWLNGFPRCKKCQIESTAKWQKEHRDKVYAFQKKYRQSVKGQLVDARKKERDKQERAKRREDRAKYRAEHPKTHCTNGHELTPDNVYEYPGKLMCKTCSREKRKKRYYEIERHQK